MRQQTIAREVRCTGIGLHTGQRVNLVVKPAAENTGIQFVRRDLGRKAIPALHRHLSDTRYATCLARGEREVRTVEHLLSAAYGLEVDNLTVELDGPEVPILDGSSAPFVRVLSQAGVIRQRRPRRYLVVRKPFEVVDGDSKIQVLPSRGLRISYAIDFQHPMIPYQEISMAMSPDRFLREIAPARTFCRLEEVEQLRSMGLVQGGSLDNAVVVSRDGLLNGNLRFRNEFVRHKILDLLGDLTLAGSRLLGHVVAFRAGHRLHARFIGELLAARGVWDLVSGTIPVRKTDPAPLEPAVATGSAS
jgi:UDP-3-O-[3-hydroxymyristoyl] N-acetylglucosamine deacetylase